MIKQFKIRIFNEAGIIEFEKFISQLRIDRNLTIHHDLIFNEEFSFELNPPIVIEKVDYINKQELVTYLSERLNLQSNKYFYFNKGLWTWLTAFFFDNICPPDQDGNRKVNESAFYVLKEPKNYTKYYRHLLAYPCRVFSELGDASKIFLVGTFAKRGEVTEQFGAYQEIALNKGIITAANILYWDTDKKNLKKGVASKGSGSARRLIRIIRQYQLTYDLNSMDGVKIVSLLPPEFSKWHKQ